MLGMAIWNALFGFGTNILVNLLVLTGDSHNAWAFDLDHRGQRVGVELAGQSVTSPGAEGTVRWRRPDALAADFVAANRQLKWCDTAQRGYLALLAEFPSGAFLFGLTSVHWREAWKYGERAFRYCNHDVGHALGSARIAAATLGWRMVLLDGVEQNQVARLLGTHRQEDFGEAEAEHADCLAVIWPVGEVKGERLGVRGSSPPQTFQLSPSSYIDEDEPCAILPSPAWTARCRASPWV